MPFLRSHKSSVCQALGLLIALSASVSAQAATRIVNSTSNDANTVGTLPYWLLNASDSDTIDCSAIAGQTITLTTSLPAITKSYTVEGAGITINGVGTYQAFQVAAGTSTIRNVTVQNALSKGGNGGSGYSGGGGGVGGGGALYVHGGSTVTLAASSLLGNVARGGDGGSGDSNGNGGAGGGGGFGGGQGGSSLVMASTGGGGGGHSNGGSGGAQSGFNGGNGLYWGGGGGGVGLNSIVPGGMGGNASPTGAWVGGAQSSGNGGGGAGGGGDGHSATGSGGSGVPGPGGDGIGTDLLFGGGGGGGAASETGFPGGAGLGAGGGGGAYNYVGGAGGVLGGGGGGGTVVGGLGGFGAGGGGAVTGGTGSGGLGAGGQGASDPSSVGAGGGGSGLGGAIFVQSGATLVVVDAVQIAGNSVVAGVAGSSSNALDPGYVAAAAGAALGSDIFVREQGSIVFNLSNTLNVATPIEGDQSTGPNGSGGLQKTGAGTLRLNGLNTYSGSTTVDGGTLNLNGSVAGHATVGAGGTLSGNATVAGDLNNSGTLAPGNSIGTIDVANLVLTGSSVLQMEVAEPGVSDQVVATGAAQLAGTLQLALGTQANRPGTYTLLAASSIAGSFSNVAFSGPVPVSYTVAYVPAGAPTSVQFTIVTPPPFTPKPVPTLSTWLMGALMLGLLWVGGAALRRPS